MGWGGSNHGSKVPSAVEFVDGGGDNSAVAEENGEPVGQILSASALHRCGDARLCQGSNETEEDSATHRCTILARWSKAEGTYQVFIEL